MTGNTFLFNDDQKRVGIAIIADVAQVLDVPEVSPFCQSWARERLQ